MRHLLDRVVPLAALLLLAACQQSGAPGNAPGTAPEGFTGIAADETILFSGTEPFWGGRIEGERLTYSTPDNIEGVSITVQRFTGQGGLGFSGRLEDESFDMTITPGECSDGMSDRTYPYVAILQIGEEQRAGCAHTESQPYTETGPAA